MHEECMKYPHTLPQNISAGNRAGADNGTQPQLSLFLFLFAFPDSLLICTHAAVPQPPSAYS
jgi:hypothetical protein